MILHLMDIICPSHIPMWILPTPTASQMPIISLEYCGSFNGIELYFKAVQLGSFTLLFHNNRGTVPVLFSIQPFTLLMVNTDTSVL